MPIQLTVKDSYLDHKPSSLLTQALLVGLQVSGSGSSTKVQIKKSNAYMEKKSNEILQKALTRHCQIKDESSSLAIRWLGHITCRTALP